MHVHLWWLDILPRAWRHKFPPLRIANNKKYVSRWLSSMMSCCIQFLKPTSTISIMSNLWIVNTNQLIGFILYLRICLTWEWRKHSKGVRSYCQQCENPGGHFVQGIKCSCCLYQTIHQEDRPQRKQCWNALYSLHYFCLLSNVCWYLTAGRRWWFSDSCSVYPPAPYPIELHCQ